MTGAVDLAWGDGERAFRLAIGQLRELQDKCAAGPAEILTRLSTGRWRVEDVRETVRLGLIGGGVTPAEAHTLTVRYVDERPLLESVMVARAALAMALVGEPEDDAGKRKAGGARSNPTVGSPSPASTGGEPSSDFRPPKSTA
jgi:hypothetical protein